MIDAFEKEQGFSGIKNLNFQILRLVSVGILEVSNKTFEELISTGQIKLIKNESLRSKLIHYYQECEDHQLSVANNMDNVYYPNIYPVIAELTLYSAKDFIAYSDTLTYQYPDRLIALLDSKIAEPETELRLINAINEYKLLAFTHQYIANEAKESTEKMLALI